MATIVIDGQEIKEVPIKTKGIQFDKTGKKETYLDSAGKPVTKIKVQGSEYKWVYDDGQVCAGKTYKSFKGKPMKPFSKTTVIKSYDIIDISDLKYFISNELTYLLVNDNLKSKLKELGKAYSFKYVNRGFKIHRAVAYYDEQIERVIMRCFQGDLRKADLTEHSVNEEITAAEDGVEEFSLEDLEV